MNRVRLEKEGLLAEKRRELIDLFSRARAFQVDLHSASNPFVPVEKMRIDEVVAIAKDLRDLLVGTAEKPGIRRVAAEIKELKEELGIDD